MQTLTDPPVRCGQFAWDGIVISGPEAYLQDRGFALVDRLLDSPDLPIPDHELERLVLGRLAADHRRWARGRR